MHDSPALEAQEEDYSNLADDASSERGPTSGMDFLPAERGQGSGIRVPPQNSIPRNWQPYLYEAGDFAAAKALQNPLPLRDEKILERGEEQYRIFCAVCHGYTGKGDGPVTPQLANVPSLVNANIRAWSDGELFHIITMGRGRMLPYAAQIAPSDRWAVIHYLRLLQLNNPENPEAQAQPKPQQ